MARNKQVVKVTSSNWLSYTDWCFEKEWEQTKQKILFESTDTLYKMERIFSKLATHLKDIELEINTNLTKKQYEEETPHKRWYKQLLQFISFGLYKAPVQYKCKIFDNENK